MNKLLALLILLAPPFDPLPDAGSVAHSVQTDTGVAQKAQPVPDCKRGCLGKCWWDADAGYCQDTRVERLGTWDPRPAAGEWKKEYSFPHSPSWPNYPQETRVSTANERASGSNATTCE